MIFQEFLVIRRGIYLNKSFVYFVEITAGDTRHTQQIHIDESFINLCPLVRVFLNACNISTWF